MKTIKSFALILLGILCFTSCELDNYDAPGGSLYGAILDVETGDTVQQNFWNGTRIALVEIDEAFENPQRLYQSIKADGSFTNNLIFEGLYSIPTIEDGNFHPTDSSSVSVDGETELLYDVLPYIRIVEPNISLDPEDSMVVIATFMLEQTVPDTINIKEVTLYADLEPTVGKGKSVDKASLSLYSPAVPDSLYTITFESRKVKAGKSYFFRLGSEIEIDGARGNYSPAVRHKLNK